MLPLLLTSLILYSIDTLKLYQYRNRLMVGRKKMCSSLNGFIGEPGRAVVAEDSFLEVVDSNPVTVH